MGDPKSSRPHMPGYGLLDAAQGTGLLPWSWAVERLERSHDYWMATLRPDGRPHAVPITVLPTIARFVAAINQKYATDYSLDFFNPDSNVCSRVRPTWAFGLTESDFTGSPTRWLFPPTTD